MNNDIQSNINQEQKNNKRIIKLITIICVVILGITAILLLLFKLNKANDNSNKILVYTNNDNDLKYITNKDDNPILLSKSYEEELNVKFNNSKTKIAYIKNRGLYMKNINSKEESDKIGVDVEDYIFINDKELIYIDVNKNLYVASSSENKNRLDIDVTKILFKKDNIVIYNKGEEVYLYNITTKEKNSILQDYDSNKKINISNNLKQILYVSTNKELKIYNIDNKDSIVKATDVYNIVNYSEDFSKIKYTKLGENKKYFDLFINDNPEDNPIQKYQCTIHNFDEYLYSANTQASDTENHIYHLYESIDYYIYFDENNKWHNVTLELYNYCNGADPSAELKEQIRKDETSVQLYNIYSLNGEEEKELVKDIYEVITSEDDIVVYTKLNIKNENKVKISSLTSVDEIKNIINQIKPTLNYTSIEKTDELLIDSFDTKNKNNVNIVNGKIYAYETNENNDLILYEYDSKTTNKEKISDKGFIINTNILKFDILYLDNFNNETHRGDLIGRTDGKNTNIDTDVYSVLQHDNNNLYYYKDFNFEKLNGTYIINNINKNKKEIIDDVSIVLNGTKDKYYIFKDYSSTSKTYSLFIKNNNTQKPIEYNVTNYVYSN